MRLVRSKLALVGYRAWSTSQASFGGCIQKVVDELFRILYQWSPLSAFFAYPNEAEALPPNGRSKRKKAPLPSPPPPLSRPYDAEPFVKHVGLGVAQPCLGQTY